MKQTQVYFHFQKTIFYDMMKIISIIRRQLMTKITKEAQLRLEGMNYAYRIAQEKGIPALEQEIKLRGRLNLPFKITRNDVNQIKKDINMTVTNAIKILAVSTLCDEFGFGQEELDRFLNRMNLKAACLSEDYVTWEEQIACIQKETGILLENPQK